MADPLITASGVKSHLIGLDAWFAAARRMDPPYTDDHMEQKVFPAVVRRLERKIKFRINPIQVVSNPDGTFNDTNLRQNKDHSLPLKVDGAYPWMDYQGEEYFVTTLTERPVQKVQRVRFMYDEVTTVYLPPTGPTGWIRVEPSAGRMYLQPTLTASFAGAISTLSLLQWYFGYKPYIPQFVAIDYIAGLPADWRDWDEWNDIGLMCEQYCALQVLNDIAHVRDAGVNSKGIGAYGANQQLNYTRFNDRKQELQKDVDDWLGDFIPQQTPIEVVLL